MSGGTRQRAFVSGLAALALVLTACGGDDSGEKADDTTDVRGVVTYDDGSPAADADVLLSVPGDQDGEGESFEGSTDSDGKFEFTDVEPGEYEVFVVGGGEETVPGEFVFCTGFSEEFTVESGGDDITLDIACE